MVMSYIGKQFPNPPGEAPNPPSWKCVDLPLIARWFEKYLTKLSDMLTFNALKINLSLISFSLSFLTLGKTSL